jgi:hypothetical protein
LDRGAFVATRVGGNVEGGNDVSDAAVFAQQHAQKFPHDVASSRSIVTVCCDIKTLVRESGAGGSTKGASTAVAMVAVCPAPPRVGSTSENKRARRMAGSFPNDDVGQLILTCPSR